jgi:hypothetical protein
MGIEPTTSVWKDKSMVFSLPLCQPRHAYFISQSFVIISMFISIVLHEGLNMLIPLILMLQLRVHQGVIEPPSVLGARGEYVWQLTAFMLAIPVSCAPFVHGSDNCACLLSISINTKTETEN